MARREIIVDDLSGIELGESVEPTTITVDGTEYKIDLGSATKEHLVRWLSGDGPYNYKSGAAAQRDADDSANGETFRLTGEASERYKDDLKKHEDAKREQRKDIQDWARGSKDFKDKVPGDRAGIKSDLLTAYYAANPEQVRYFGDGAAEAPNRADYR